MACVTVQIKSIGKILGVVQLKSKVLAKVQCSNKVLAKVERVSAIQAEIERVCLVGTPYLEVIPLHMWIQQRDTTQVRSNRNWRIENN